MPAENVEVLLRTVREIQEGLHDGEEVSRLDSSAADFPA
jgi:hypothetical protein